MAVAALFTEGNLSSGERENRDNRWVLAAFGVSGFLLAYLPALTDRLDFWTFGGEAVRWIGVVLYIVGGVLRIWPVFVLGKRFSGLVAIQLGHTLVTDGIYRRIRNPSYLGLVNSVGWALAFRSGVGLLLVVLTMVPLVARIRSEEALLRTQFGTEYDAYCARASAAGRVLTLFISFPPPFRALPTIRSRCVATCRKRATPCLAACRSTGPDLGEANAGVGLRAFRCGCSNALIRKQLVTRMSTARMGTGAILRRKLIEMNWSAVRHNA